MNSRFFPDLLPASWLPVGFGAVLLLTGCVSPVPPLETADVPETWLGPVEENAEIWPSPDWWNNFGNAELTTIIAAVQENNLDLANNQRNLEAAQLVLREAGFNLLPTPVVTIGTGATYSDSNRDFGGGTSGLGGSGGNNGGVGGNGGGSNNTPFTITGGFTYNDILSKPANYERAVADYDARVAQVADVALNTLGTAASTYFQLLLTRDKIVAAQQNVANAEAIGNIAQARVDAGVAVPIEALQQRIATERERNNLRSLVQNDLAARSSLAMLLGRSVQGFQVEGQTLQTIIVPAVQPGLPSGLLQRRPDLVQAEANLRSANANIAIVRSDLFPQISLTGSVNTSSTSLTELLSSPGTTLNISANLVQTLLDNGQRLRNVEQARLSMENSLSSYRSVVIGAFNEVEVMLSNILLLEALGEVAFQNLGFAEESFRIAQVRYEEGVEDFQTVLQAQNTLFSSRNAWLDNKLLQLNAQVGLYQALGGGWQAEP